MKRYLTVIFLFLALLVIADNRPLMLFDFSNTAPDGTVKNSGKGNYTARISGKYKVHDGGILAMDGLTTQIFVDGSENFDISNNATFVLLYKREALPGNDHSNMSMDGFFAKSGEFIITKYKNHLYSNIKVGNRWGATWQLFDMFKEIDGNWHHVAATVQYFDNPAEAERWVEISFYLDGVPAGRRRFDRIKIPHNRKKLEIAGNSGMGPSWRLGGKIAAAAVYDRILSEHEIQTLVLEQKLAKPAFTPDKKLTAAQLNKIKSLKVSAPAASALTNILCSTSEHLKDETFLKNPNKLISLDGKNSTLVIAEKKNFVHIMSFFDRIADRELLRPENPFAEWQLISGKTLSTFNPFDRSVSSYFKQRPVKYKNGKKFIIGYKHPDFSADIEYYYADDRLEMKISASAANGEKMLFSTAFPKVAMKPFKGKGETLVVPYACGIAYPEPSKNNIRYSNPYPRAFNTMQFLSYYDTLGGIYIGCEDPLARVKHTDTGVSVKCFNAEYQHRVPYEKPDTVNHFKPNFTAALEIFRGSWYDAGMIYRRQIASSGASFFRKTLPNTDTPEYFRNNSLFVAVTYLGEFDPHFEDLRDYLGMNYMLGDIWKWWEEGPNVNLSPMMRATPEWLEYVKQLKRKGIHILPYIDGRLWAQRDKRGKDHFFSRIGAGSVVISNGKTIIENYRMPCYVLCPATKVYQDVFFDFITRLTAQGTDGLYVDQLGATYQPLCDLAGKHDHIYADTLAWSVKGYWKFINRLRAHWRSRNTPKILTTEDNAEWCVNYLDGLEVYRWSNEHQIPLFPLIYSGRAQMYNRHAKTKAARFQTAAEQLVNSEQLGSFGMGELISPFNQDLRSYVKRLAWMRQAMLDFFNKGMMSRPASFTEQMPSFKRRWSDFGTRSVTKPQIQSSVWKYDDCMAAVLINTEDSKCANTVIIPDAPENTDIYIFEFAKSLKKRVHKNSSNIKWQFELQPRSCALLLVVPEGKNADLLIKHIEKCFKHINSTASKTDRFSVDNLPETEIIDGSKGCNLVDSAEVIGARRNRFYNRIDYVSYAMLYPGTVDFGKKAPEIIEMDLACGTPQGGKIKIFADGITGDHQIAEITLAPEFRTADWNTYTPVTAKLSKKLTGKHKLIILVEGLGFVNLKHWKLK